MVQGSPGGFYDRLFVCLGAHPLRLQKKWFDIKIIFSTLCLVVFTAPSALPNSTFIQTCITKCVNVLLLYNNISKQVPSIFKESTSILSKKPISQNKVCWVSKHLACFSGCQMLWNMFMNYTCGYSAVWNEWEFILTSMKNNLKTNWFKLAAKMSYKSKDSSEKRGEDASFVCRCNILNLWLKCPKMSKYFLSSINCIDRWPLRGKNNYH